MDLKVIRYFLILADSLSFTKAAEQLNISQPALTKAIRKFEMEIGGVLIHRDGKDPRLTELGRSLRTEFEAILKSVEKAEQLAQMIATGHQTTINFGVSNTLGPLPISAYFKAAFGQLENSRILLQESLSMDLPSLVLSGSLDCCICSDCDISSPKLKIIPLFDERLLLACSSQHPFATATEISAEDLHEEPYLDRLNCEFRLKTAEILGNSGVFMKPMFQSDREEWIQHLVLQGVGVALLPEFSVRLEGVVLRPVRGLDLSRKVQFIIVSGTPPNKNATVLAGISSQFPWPRSDSN